ncbi:glycosyltransferase [Candidatus Roizmanbacteria bacterium]|nr:glycosyltransferase [Candidatus Roizmanbacteria bacterium]
MNVSIILPTFNEKDNIILLIKAISSVLNKNRYTYEIIVIDDNSPDGTGYLCKKQFKANKVNVFIRKKEKGFASAIMYGIKKSRGKFIVVMDTDFSHDPKLIPVMLKKIKGYDIIIGSRYANGGGENKLRYSLSKIYNIFLHFLVGIDIKDSLFGYFCIKKSFLQKNNLITSQIFYGFGDYFIRLAYQIKKSKGKFLEIPAFYKNRIHGKSKSNLFNMLITYTKTALELRLKS